MSSMDYSYMIIQECGSGSTSERQGFFNDQDVDSLAGEGER